MPKVFTAKIASNVPASHDAKFRLLKLQPLDDITAPEPGQFYMVQAGPGLDPLLKRPFSIYDMQQNMLGFLYRVRGKGTLSLSRQGQGETLQVIGPLGNSYPAPEGDFIAVAGGIGIASLIPLLRRHKKRAYLFYGAMNSSELVMLEEATELAKEISVTTNNGSAGQKGLITDSVKAFLEERDRNLKVFACGPSAMLKALSVITHAAGLTCYASLEEHMACGVGACLGCMVKVKSSTFTVDSEQFVYKRVCKEGPVFDIEEIIW